MTPRRSSRPAVSNRGLLLRSILLGLAMLTFAVSSSFAQGIDEAAWRIAQELQCPICQGQSVAESNSQLAIQMRALIREKLTAGETRDEIIHYFTERYGENILMSPPRSGFTTVAWLAPYLGALAAVGFLVWVVRRRSEAAGSTALGVSAEQSSALDPYLAEVDRSFERLKDEPLR